MCYNNNKSFFPNEQADGLGRDGKSENFQLVEVRFMLVSAAEMLKKAKKNNLYIPIPEAKGNKYDWTINNGFTEL